MTDPVPTGRRRDRSQFHRDFATVCAGYVAGHGILRLFAGFLVGIGDSARAALLERWYPVWNALGFFVAAWGLYHLVLWLERYSNLGGSAAAPPPAAPGPEPSVGIEPSARPAPKTTRTLTGTAVPSATKEAPSSSPPVDWKAQLKALQQKKDVAAILAMQESLLKTLPAERARRLDQRLGWWYTKHFQRMMLTGRAAEAATDVELVAEHYAESEEFGYFKEILPVVRQCAELKQSLEEEE